MSIGLHIGDILFDILTSLFTSEVNHLFVFLRNCRLLLVVAEN